MWKWLGLGGDGKTELSSADCASTPLLTPPATSLLASRAGASSFASIAISDSDSDSTPNSRSNSDSDSDWEDMSSLTTAATECLSYCADPLAVYHQKLSIMSAPSANEVVRRLSPISEVPSIAEVSTSNSDVFLASCTQDGDGAGAGVNTDTDTDTDEVDILPSQEVHVVCFHGRGQTMDGFSDLLKTFRKKAKSRGLPWVFHHRQGFFPARVLGSGGRGNKYSGYGWYDTDSKTGDMLPLSDKFLKHKHDCFEHLVRFSEGHNDALIILLGFSEGAAFALDMAHTYCERANSPFIGVIAVAPPSLPHFPNDSVSMARPCREMKTLIFGSKQDKCVPLRQCTKWAKWFPSSEVLTSDMGHKIPFQRSTLRNRVFDSFDSTLP
jgi:predicted esterase